MIIVKYNISKDNNIEEKKVYKFEGETFNIKKAVTDILKENYELYKRRD